MNRQLTDPSLMEWLHPECFALKYGSVRKPDPTVIPNPTGRPDYADVLDHDNNAIEEINDSVLDAEINGGLPRMAYPLPLEQR